MDPRQPTDYYYGPPGSHYPPQYMQPPHYPPRHPGHPHFDGYRPPYFAPDYDLRFGPRPSAGLQLDGQLSQPELNNFARYKSEPSPNSGTSSPLLDTTSERASPQEPPAGMTTKEYHKKLANDRRKKRNREAQQKARQKQKKLIEDLNLQLEQTKREKTQLKTQVQELQQQIRVLLSSNNPNFGTAGHSQNHY